MIGITIISDILLLNMIKRKSKYQLQLIMIFGVIAGIINKLFLLSNGINF